MLLGGMIGVGDTILTLESADQASDRTAIACEVNVVDKALLSRSKMKI